MITDFFKNLSQYFQKENDLSDISCAMCHTSNNFKRIFVNFFFPELEISRIVNIRREVCDENGMHSRVDLMIDVMDDTTPYLIEVKIYDQQHHFGQYESAYSIGKERLGYITNYICKDGIEKGYDVKTWHDLHDLLESNIAAVPDPEEKQLLEGYLVFLKQVCGFTDVITSLDPLPDVLSEMMKIMRAGLSSCRKELDLRITSTLSSDYTYTFFFKTRDNKEAGGWLGLYDWSVNPTVCIGFQSNLNKSSSIYKRIRNEGLPNNNIMSVPMPIKAFSGNCMLVPMSQSCHDSFAECRTSTQQIEIIALFINTVLMCL